MIILGILQGCTLVIQDDFISDQPRRAVGIQAGVQVEVIRDLRQRGIHPGPPASDQRHVFDAPAARAVTDDSLTPVPVEVPPEAQSVPWLVRRNGSCRSPPGWSWLARRSCSAWPRRPRTASAPARPLAMSLRHTPTGLPRGKVPGRYYLMPVSRPRGYHPGSAPVSRGPLPSADVRGSLPASERPAAMASHTHLGDDRAPSRVSRRRPDLPVFLDRWHRARKRPGPAGQERRPVGRWHRSHPCTGNPLTVTGRAPPDHPCR